MTNNNFETVLGTTSFLLLFFIMILYWVQIVFSIIPKFNFIIFFSTLFANATLFTLLVLRWWNYRYFPLSNLYESLIFLSWSFTLTELFFTRLLFDLMNFNFLNENSNTQKKQPTNLASLSSLNKDSDIKNFKNPLRNVEIHVIIGTILSPIALFINSFATFSLPPNMQKAQALVPALQSNWLMMHVTVMLLSYTALLCGSLLAMTYLVITWDYFREQKKKFDFVPIKKQVNNSKIDNQVRNSPFLNSYLTSEAKLKTIEQINNFPDSQLPLNGQVNKLYKTAYPVLFDKTSIRLNNQKLAPIISFSSKKIKPTINKTQNKKNSINNQTINLKPLNQGSRINLSSKQLNVSNFTKQSEKQEVLTNKVAETLDNLSYRILGIGFALLTIGILSGAVWANETWGSYWSWDPKETWAFITWLIFATYLHTRIIKGWQGKKPAIIASVGFVIVWICYLGVNILGIGLHSYGWFQSHP